MQKPVLGKSLSFTEVKQVINDLHVDFRDRQWYPDERAELHQDSSWYEAMVPRDLIENLVWGDYHWHDSGRTDLMTPTTSVAEAVETYPSLDPNHSQANKDCVEKVEGIRGILRSGEKLQPLILVWHERQNYLEHIDGLHRMLAWIMDTEEEEIAAVLVHQAE